jgi:hypothetical protein
MDEHRVFNTWNIVALISMVLGAGLGVYALVQGQVGGAIAMSCIFLVGLTLAVGGHYLKKRVGMVKCTLIAVNSLRKNWKTPDGELIARIRASRPKATEEYCLVAITRAKEFLFKPEYLTSEIKREIEAWEKVSDS